MAFNLNKLKGRLVEKELTGLALGKMLNISETAIFNKLNGNTEFKRSEIEIICKILEIPISEIGEYFFDL